jgi:serine/threonine protein kinase
MKIVCSRCGQMSGDGHLWCQQIDCPVGNVPIVLTYGEFLGDIKVVRLLRLFRTAAIYEAERATEDGDIKILLKVAHKGHEEILKMEAQKMRELQGQNIMGLPDWLPPYLPSSADDPPYGKAVFRSETKYYILFDYINGSFLRDLLLENPEPWYRDAAWITIGLANAVSNLHKSGNFLHANINPDVVIITRDEKTRIPRPTLLDAGVVYQQTEQLSSQRINQIRHHVAPAYTAPEIIQNPSNIQMSNATDVYNLGILMYEMLAGKPAVSYVLRSDEEILNEIRNMQDWKHMIYRRDVPNPTRVNEIVSKAIMNRQQDRFKSVGQFRNELVQIFGDVPPPKVGRNYLRILMIAVVGLAAFAVIGILLDAFLG